MTVDWQRFDRVTFAEPGSSGRGFENLPPLGELNGTVVSGDGQQFSGRIGFDLDEGEG